MNFQKVLIPLIVILSLIAVFYYFNSDNKETKQEENISSVVKNAPFKIFVNATGELEAKNSVKIKGPSGMRAAQIYNVTINDMVAEGTMVKEGDYVASLDKTELSTKVKEAQNELDKIETQLEQAKIDTAIELRSIRNELINLKFSKEEKRLQVEQSRYEPQMVIQQSEIEMQKTERDYKQLLEKYELSKTKSIAQISEIMASYRTIQMTLDRLLSLTDEFTIKAPKEGMVIYTRSWNGKVSAGSQISTWDPAVAELPDLTDMISKTYVNEVDISKITKGQDVNIKVDAFPDNDYNGSVINVANIGEQLSGYDAKVFEVTVQLHGVDSILRPAMTTSNEILVHSFDQVLHVPLDAIFNDSLTFVYKENKGSIVKQEVIVGESNDDEVIIAQGLKDGDKFYFSAPSNAADLKMNLIDPTIKAQVLEELEKKKAKRQAEAAEKSKTVQSDHIQKSKSGGSVIIFN